MYNNEKKPIGSIEDLKQAMEAHAADADALYKKAVVFNVFNEQFFLDWQDRLNYVSYTHEEDMN